MGIFKKLKKAVKGVFKGIGNVFKKILKPFQKILSSKWGKVLMIAASIFTLGTAMMAGYTAWTSATGNMLAKFVASGKDFIFSLIGKQTVYGAKGSLAAANTAAEGAKAGIGAGDPLAAAGDQGEGLLSALEGGESTTEALTGSVGTINSPTELAGNAAMGTEAITPGNLSFGADGTPFAGAPPSSGITPNNLVFGADGTPMAGGKIAADVAKQAAEGGGMFSKAGEWLGKNGKGLPGGETAGNLLQGMSDFAATPGGGALFGSVIGGLGEGMLAKEALEDERRERRKYNREWAEYDWDSVDFDVNSDIGRKPIGSRRTYESGIRMGTTTGA